MILSSFLNVLINLFIVGEDCETVQGTGLISEFSVIESYLYTL
jgi:hypothetical protein